jgi:hypothetical protein
MGQHIPDRLFWAREDGESRGADAPAAKAADDPADPARRSDARGTH